MVDKVGLLLDVQAFKAENERLRAQLKNAVWTDSELCKILEADNVRLRAALDPFAKHAHCTNEIQPSSLSLWCAQALNALCEDDSNQQSPTEPKCTCPEDWQGMDHTAGCKSRASR